MALDDVIVTRAAYRDELRRAFTETAKASLEKVEGGPWDGVPVLTEPKLDEAIAAIFDLPVPTPSEMHAEVKTPSRILVAALCPRCDLPTTILLTVEPELRVDRSSAEIHVKTKAKGRSHVCGQLEVGLKVDESAALENASFAALLGGEAISSSELLDLLSLVKDHFSEGTFPTLEEIDGWTEPYRERVRAWATKTYKLGSDEEAPDWPDPDEPAETNETATDAEEETDDEAND